MASTLSHSPRLPSFLVFGGVSAVVLAVLYAFNPYATGYGSTPVSILHFANTLWSVGEDWQHCYIVPFAIAAMVWFERERLPSVPFTRSWAGLALTVFALFCYWIGFRADNIYIGYGSFQLLVGGLILWLMGWQWARALFVPWAFLVFLYPLAFLDNLIAFPLRMVMSEASVHALNLVGIASIKSGTAILSAPDMLAGMRAGEKFSVDVADPCSGIRSLFALMMVSALYGYFTQRSPWKRAVIFLCSIPLAVLGNLVRILMLTLGTIAMGPEIAIGSLEDPTLFHMLAGYVVFAVALAGMLGIAWLLNLNWASVKASLLTPPPPRNPGSPSPTLRKHVDEY